MSLFHPNSSLRSFLASPPSSSRNEPGGLSQRLLHLNWLQHRQIARQIAAFDLTVPQFYTLITLINLGGSATMGTLSRELNQVSATMTGIVDRLVREGLVERSRSDEDRRAVLVTLTPRGYEIVEKAWAQSLNALDRMLSQMSDSERELAVRLLDALMAQLANGRHSN
ncbi:MAG: MarR family transcriptional regulator [Caldilineales bacterium]|nr:MarR family transcriptional regulator [Caldilineales bacterium]